MPVTLSEAAQTTIRMLIASYFIAAAAGSIPGSDTAALFSPFLPDPIDRIVGAGLVLIFAVMVMLGRQTRAAALLLGLITFYASYVQLIQQGVEQVLGIFWRDMALVAALMLTYGGDRQQARERLGLDRRPVNGRGVRVPRVLPPPEPEIRNIFAPDTATAQTS